MGSGRRYMDDPLAFNRNPPPSSSSPISVSNPLDGFLGESTSRSGSFESESISEEGDFGAEKLAGTVEFYERHVFLCYKKPSFWPARIEASEFDRLPRLLSSVVSARKSDMKKEVLVKDVVWLPGNPEPLSGSYVFVCCHGSRDRRCGVCGPSLVSRFREDIEMCGLEGQVSVSPCSHIGGHKYTGDVIIYGSNINQRVTGNWYGLVTLEDVPQLLEQHIYRGQILDRLWRGEMGLLEEDQKKTQEQRFQERNAEKINNGEVSLVVQQNGNSSWCLEEENHTENITSEKEISVKSASSRVSSSKKGSSCGFKVCAAMSMWLENWEKEDTYAALSVVCAAASVAIAYNCYKQLK
ncbi:hypothetical protein HID58_087905 [Brassica napus]|uniref:Sucrase/ferredoxin-like family protein n=1 Tax=Brassica napus TaxID=3708 RepID=A0ABQ7XUM2_BRANA|nr:hypothetical protein HID58_087905 [Brassica napus]